MHIVAKPVVIIIIIIYFGIVVPEMCRFCNK